MAIADERLRTARALSEREEDFMRLKVEGVLECGELLVAALMEGRERHIFGRRTLPEMDLASVACAIQNVCLAARAEGLGLGWVSLFDPEALAALLGMPVSARPVAVLCLGSVERFYDRPMLELEGWAERQASSRTGGRTGGGKPLDALKAAFGAWSVWPIPSAAPTIVWACR